MTRFLSKIRLQKKKNKNLYSREGGWCEYFYKQEGLDADTIEKIRCFKNKTFSMPEFKQLSEQEKDYLRDIAKLPYLKNIDRQNKNRSIENDMQFFVTTAYKLKNILDYKYPDGWIFVAIGGSTAPFAKILEYMGAQTKIIPYSSRVKYQDGFQDIDFNKYFYDIGYKATDINPHKTIIYTDFVSSGETLRDFKHYINSTGRSTPNDIFVNFSDLPENTINSGEKELLDEWFFNKKQIKSYSPCPNMTKPVQYINAKNMNKEFEWNFTTKLMNFAILDCLDEWTKKGWIN